MIHSPLVSIVIATYNYGRYLAGAIDSVLAQTYPDFELIIIDDGSTDDTSNVIGPCLVDSRVFYLKMEHVGQPGAKNAGIRRSRGEFIAFLDGDDLWLPTKLEKQVSLFQQLSAEVGVVYCRRLWIDEEGRELETWERNPLRGDVLGPLFYRPFICFSSSMVRRSVLDAVGLFDESIPLAIDYDLWLRVASRYRFDYLDEALVFYRIGHANLSRRAEERLRISMRIMRRFLDEQGGRERLDPAVVRLAWSEIYYQMGQIVQRRSRVAALPWYVRALASGPGHGESWRGLISLAVPSGAWSWLRRQVRPGTNPGRGSSTAG